MRQTIYADSVLNISLAEGVVRFDLVTLSPAPTEKAGAENKEKKLLASEVATVATSLPGFIRMHEQMTQVINQLVEQGLITRNAKNKENKDDSVAVTK